MRKIVFLLSFFCVLLVVPSYADNSIDGKDPDLRAKVIAQCLYNQEIAEILDDYFIRLEKEADDKYDGHLKQITIVQNNYRLLLDEYEYAAKKLGRREADRSYQRLLEKNRLLLRKMEDERKKYEGLCDQVRLHKYSFINRAPFYFMLAIYVKNNSAHPSWIKNLNEEFDELKKIAERYDVVEFEKLN